jgi:hypothetical protein
MKNDTVPNAMIAPRDGELVDEPALVEALRTARRQHPDGATLYRVPLPSRKADSARLLVNASEVPLQNAMGDDATTNNASRLRWKCRIGLGRVRGYSSDLRSFVGRMAGAR